jgi:hypothetical protein
MLDGKCTQRYIPSHMQPFLEKGGNSYEICIKSSSGLEERHSRLDLALAGRVQCIYDLHADTPQPINNKTKEVLEKPENVDMHELVKEVSTCRTPCILLRTALT